VKSFESIKEDMIATELEALGYKGIDTTKQDLSGLPKLKEDFKKLVDKQKGIK
jgi:spermidine/putrescine-binding protein